MPTTPPSTASKAASGGSRGSGSPSQKRAASPSKRRRVESEAEGEREPEPEPDDDLPPSARTQDPDKTPMPSTKTDALRQQYGRISLQPSQRPILRPSSPGKRSSSPVKAMRDLQRLQKPVRFAQLPSLGRRRKEVLPADVHKIVHEISSRTVGGFIPGILKEEFARMLECDLDDIPAVWFRDDGEASEGSKAEVDKAVLLRELYGLKAILRSAIESAELRRSEPAWNAKVHQPILDLAFGDGLWRDADEQGAWPEGEAESRRVGAEYVATATLTGDCIPRLRAQYKSGPVQEETASDTSSVLACSATSSSDSTASGFLDEDVFGNIQDMPRARKVHDGTVHSRAGSKKVDFALVITPGRGTRLAQAIDEMIDRLDAQGLANLDAGRPQPSLSINPTQYEPLQRRPIASIIETKIVPDPQDPQVLLQLGFMVAALHKRMTGFLMHSHPPSYITVPIISVVCHDWTLHFACDRQSHIVCVPAPPPPPPPPPLPPHVFSTG